MNPKKPKKGNPMKKYEVETVEMAPSWEELLPLFLEAAKNGSKPALQELQRMAKIADAYVASRKGGAK